MKKTSIIYVVGELLVRSFKADLRKKPSEVVIIRLNSNGGDTHAMNTMSAFLYYLLKYKKREVIFEIEYAESAALMLAVNFPHRRVIATSIGSIHLPVLGEGKYSSESVVENKKRRAINFFTSHTKLTEEQVISLNGKILTAQQMIETGIATEIVEEFSPPTACTI